MLREEGGNERDGLMRGVKCLGNVGLFVIGVRVEPDSLLYNVSDYMNLKADISMRTRRIIFICEYIVSG